MKLIKNNDYNIAVIDGPEDFQERVVDDMRRKDYERQKHTYQSYAHYKGRNYWRREEITHVQLGHYDFTYNEPVPVVKTAEEIPNEPARVNVADMACTEHDWPKFVSGEIDDSGHCHQCGMSYMYYESMTVA